MTTINSSILRFEDEEGFGLYSSDPYPQNFFSKEDYDKKHLAPSEDELFKKNAPNGSWWPYFIFGFKDLTQLRAWLYKDAFLIECYKAGKYCYEFEGEIILGHTQCAIRKATAKKIRKLTLEELGVDKELI